MSTSVLYDAPGPRARRRSRIISVVSIAVILGLLAAAAWRLGQQGQFSPELWSPLFWPGDDDFVTVWGRVGTGIRNTLLAAAAAIALSLAIGVAVTTTRLMLGRGGRLPVVVLVELLRGTPVVVLIFFSGKILPALGVGLDTFWQLVIGLTLYNSVVIAEILRAGVAALPRGQREAGLAIGLTKRQTLLTIQMPQAFRLMLPALISQLVVIVKDTSLAGIILTGPEELLRIGEQLRNFFGNPLQVAILLIILFVTINVLLSRLATYVERKLSESRSKVSSDLDVDADQVADATTADDRRTDAGDASGHGRRVRARPGALSRRSPASRPTQSANSVGPDDRRAWRTTSPDNPGG
ncbi:ABC transporter permease subunit [Aquipuribacter nitratireducens]|uniref:Amino acid ABC transporter permease n=1 Tax=Aquipuribacter nitratireducens TaxID=650104 RepID=A0ABW0GJ62_9MICO